MKIFNFFGLLFLVNYFDFSGAFLGQNFIELDDFIKVLIPTTNSINSKCLNHSKLYLEGLKGLKIWATEMFDSSSKFPSGLLFGSNFNLGNYDECVEVKVPLEDEETLQGRYCMAKFQIQPPENVENSKKFRYQYYEYDNFINVTAWEKIVAFANDRSVSSRNDFYFSYCIPSSCNHQDLDFALKQIVKYANSISDFKISVSVDPKSCQVKNELKFNQNDIIFMGIVGFFVILVLSATFYDWIIKLDELKAYQLQGTKHKLIICFSIWTNLKKLGKKSKNDDGLECIHGFKVISMCLIIMGHRIMFGIGSPLLNSNFIESMYGKVETTVLLNGPIIVDTFFNISGFLACYLMLSEFDKIKSNFNFLSIYLHRFIRLTPAYAIVVAFYATIFVKTGSGPFWNERVGVEQERCKASWWANLLYLNNYVNKDQICMFQSWYMTCDMHFFLTTPILVLLLKKRPRIGLATLASIVVMSICVVFAVVFINKEDGILLVYMKLLRDPVINDTFKNIYIPTHMRASPYYVGMITGYIKYKIRQTDYKIPRSIVWIGWLACIFVIETTVYIAFVFYIPGKPYDPLMSALYASIHHFTWSICISWMIIAVSEGNGAWIESVVSWQPLASLSRITYTAFLCHGAIQLYSAAILRHPGYASIFSLVTQMCGDITLAYVLGFVISMFFEAPILRLEKLILGGGRKNKEKQSESPKIKIISDN